MRWAIYSFVKLLETLQRGRCCVESNAFLFQTIGFMEIPSDSVLLQSPLLPLIF